MRLIKRTIHLLRFAPRFGQSSRTGRDLSSVTALSEAGDIFLQIATGFNAAARDLQ